MLRPDRRRPRTPARQTLRTIESLESRRLLSAGGLDATFGIGGKVLTDLPGPMSATANAAVLQSDGKLLVAGQAARVGETNAGDFFVARYAAGNSGALDPTFGGGAGYVTIDFGGHDDTAFAVALTPGGKIVVAGTAADVPGSFNPNPPADFAVARLMPDGSLDATFDGDGRQTIDFGGTTRAQARDVAVKSDGGLLLAGSGNRITLAALRPDGAPDLSFGSGGKASAPGGSASALAFDAAGNIVVAANNIIMNGADHIGLVARFLPNGQVDLPFGGRNTGVAQIDFGTPDTTDVSVLPSGKILAVGSNFAVARLNPNGTLDLPYGGGDGIASVTGLPSSRGSLAGVPLADGSIVIGGATLAATGDRPVPTLAKFDPGGALDNSFGAGGIVQTGEGGIQDLLLTPAQGLLTAGTTVADAANTSHLVVSRRTPTGQLDPAFGPAGRGYVLTDIAGPGLQAVTDLVALPGGGAYALGTHYNSGGRGNDFALARYTPSGALDGSFGAGGVVYTDNELRSDTATALALQADGLVVAAGRSGADVLVVRYLADGSLDKDFGNGGRVVISSVDGKLVTPTPPNLIEPLPVVDLAVQDDGRIIVVTTVGTTRQFALVRLTPAGQFDPTFGGGDGMSVPTDRPTGTAAAAALAPGGKIVVAGTSTGSPSSILVACYNRDGTPDPSFGAAGVAPGGSGIAAAVAVGGDGTVLVGGTAGGNFVAQRLLADGQTDRTFAGGTRATADFEGGDDVLRDLALLPDGSFVLVGAGLSPTAIDLSTDFALAAFTRDGQPNLAFGAGDGTADGKTSVDFAGRSDVADAVAIDEQGRILLGGGALVPGRSSDFALARLEGSGASGPVATSLAISAPTWSDAFRSVLETQGVGADRGYLLLRTSAPPVLPWSNLDTLTFHFRSTDAVDPKALRVRGVNVADYAPGAVEIDRAAHTVTWRLAQPVVNDKIVIELGPGGSGAGAGAFQWRVSVLAGDVNGDGSVNALDLSDVKRRLNKSAANPGTGTAAYSVFADVTGDTRINAVDLSSVKQRLNRRLPTGNPAALDTDSVTKDLFGTAAILA